MALKLNYGSAILSGFDYLLSNYPEVFVIGQGLWSPWYVGNSMTDLDKKFGVERIIDTPVSESACTGAAVGASIAGMRPIVVHPRMDFMLYAIDPIVNQAAKWKGMFGGQATAGLTIRAIINRGGEQGAQHSQSLHSWFSHIPGLRVVMPSSALDARDLLIASALCDDPVLYIDDRWLYDLEGDLPDVDLKPLELERPKVIKCGNDLTIAASGYSTRLAIEASEILMQNGVSAEIVDIRILSPYDASVVCESVTKTRRLLVVDGGWKNCGFASEVICSALESIDTETLIAPPVRITLPNCSAPCSKVLENSYYPDRVDLVDAALKLLNR